VDSADLGLWQASYGIDGGGDADEDGDTDGADFLVWQQEYTGALPLAAAAAVPEPAGVALVGCAALVYCAGCRGRGRRGSLL
jgi:hypothetical protein